MTMWTPTIPRGADSKSRALLDALQHDVHAGRLQPGDRLPTQRELADRLGIAIGTVSRAYAVATRRGLVTGEIGRGTFVRGREVGAEEGAVEGEDPSLIDLSKNRLIRDRHAGLAARTLEAMAARSDLDRLLDYYQPAPGMTRHRAMGASWIARAGLDVPAERVILTSGAQHGTVTVLTALTRPGDLVLTESVTYTGMKAIASLLHLQLRGLPLDEHGVRPDAFAEACRESRPRALYCMPTLQNPTGATMPLRRREEIAAVAREHDVALVEDDVYGFLPDSPLPPLAALAPTQTYYITSTSKSLAPGLRIGYVVVPPGKAERVSGVIRATTWLTAPLLAELVSEWIERGDADAMVAWKQAETSARTSMVAETLGPWISDSIRGERSFHFWLSLPEPWRTETFVAQAKARGVVVSPSEEFVVGRESAPHAIRVCLGATVSRERLGEGLQRVSELLRTGPEPSLSSY
jgi:DNA-binding transcriptional MocR family regulator